jgi:hypothetical protein
MSKLGTALRARFATPAAALRALGLDEELLALDAAPGTAPIDRIIPALRKKYLFPQTVLARLGLDEDLLDNPNPEADQMNADQVLEGLKAAIADMDEEERYRLMEMLSELVSYEDSVPPAGDPAPSTGSSIGDRRSQAHDALIARSMARLGRHSMAADRALTARSRGTASFDAMFPQAKRLGVA